MKTWKKHPEYSDFDKFNFMAIKEYLEVEK